LRKSLRLIFRVWCVRAKMAPFPIATLFSYGTIYFMDESQS